MTAIDPARHGFMVEGLDSDPDPGVLAHVIRGALIHRDWAPLMGLGFDADRRADQHIRPIDQVLGRIRELVDWPLRVPRSPGDRMVAVCRHFAVLHVGLLRLHGVPARARAGFGGYFGHRWEDHWITEWWDGSRWVRHDAQLGSQAAEMLKLDFDPMDLPAGKFLTGAEAWQLCRAGDADPDDFGIFDIRGLDFVAADLLLDMAALNKVELLPWDALGPGPDWRPVDAELADVDRLARLICADELSAIRDEYTRRPVPATITSLIDGVPTPVDLGRLVAVDTEEFPC